MRTFGVMLLMIGAIWALIAFSADTTVKTEAQYIGGTYIPGQRIHNIGMMDERRNQLMLAALVVVVGVVLFAAGGSKSPTSPAPALAEASLTSGNRKCPFCAEIIKQEAIICRFCQREIPPLEILMFAYGVKRFRLRPLRLPRWRC